MFRDFRDTGDIITDFSVTEGDKIVFKNNLGVDFSNLKTAYDQATNTTLFNVDMGASASTYEMQIKLSGGDFRSLTAANFLFTYEDIL